MEYQLKLSQFFLQQIDDRTDEAVRLIEEKLKLAKINPFRFKRIYGYKCGK